MVIPQPLVDEMLVHAWDQAPEEACGLLAGARGRASAFYPITNSEHSPRFYVMDSEQQLKALLDIDERGLDILAIFHSHPATEPRPSPTDIELAPWPGVEYVIVSLRDPQRAEVKAWTIEDGRVRESVVEVGP